ncbi:LysE family transporter [Paraconexibacter algicola]|uniref:Lysine transporter LysE n=1 Tax=Paraconexibacter algicola TaxID=2133960 RepID=A0A2T4UME2_9ACTN|nr:LysE family transporter [Paraconexibacter algicola]PTL60402.1 lysine transporter LysE [Paraconexibacter algicola]
MSDALVLGFGLGFVVAAAIGPISLLCMRTVLRGSLRGGVAIGAGAAVVDATYALLGALGAGQVLQIDALALALGLLGAAVIATLGLRTLWSAFRVRMGGEATEEVAGPRAAFATALAATASNPMTIASWAAVFAAASTAGAADGPGATALLVAGVGLGTLTWFTVLSLALAVARRRVGERLLRAIDVGSGLGLLLCAGLLGRRTLQDG